MEIAIIISGKNDIHGVNLVDYYSQPNNDYEKELHRGLDAAFTLLEKRGHKNIHCIYYGSEFCEKNLPSIEDVIQVAEKCKSLGLKFSYLTPPLTDMGVELCARTIDELLKRKLSFEVIANDIGLVWYLQKKENVTIVMGRLFDKISHDGRTSPSEIEGYYGEKGKRYAGSSGIFSAKTLGLIEKLKVERVEMDLPVQQIFVEEEQLKKSLYVPFSYMTTGRKCMIGSVGIEGNEGDFVCSHYCARYKQLMVKTNNTLSKNKKDILIRKGNTIYFTNLQFERYMDLFDRIVLEKQL